MEKNKKVEVCFTPELFSKYRDEEAIIVVTDILRASSAICTAFKNGVKELIPVGTLEEAAAYKEKGYMVAAERDAVIQDFADFGNSPFNFTEEAIGGKSVVYSTTNGTQAVQLAAGCHKIVVGAFINISALNEWLVKANRNVIILCAGWKGKFSLEDSVFAGALSEKLIESNNYSTICDSALAAMDLWSIAKNDLLTYIDKAANRTRLKKLGLDDVMEHCHTSDLTDVIPILKNKKLINVTDY